MMEPSFEKLLVRLAEWRVDFVLVGGLAVALNGYVRLTEDVDVLIAADEGNVRRFLDCLAGFGEGFASELGVEDFGSEEGAVRIVEVSEDCQIDVFTVMGGLRYEDLLENAEMFEMKGKVIRYAGKSDLITLKGRSVREKDRMDVQALRRLMEDPGAFD